MPRRWGRRWCRIGHRRSSRVPAVIRPFKETDVGPAGAIAAATQPPYLAEAGMTLWPQVYRVAGDRFCLAAAGDDGEVVGCGALWQVGGGKFRLDIMVHPHWQLRGVGSELLAPLLAEARRRGATRIQA